MNYLRETEIPACKYSRKCPAVVILEIFVQIVKTTGERPTDAPHDPEVEIITNMKLTQFFPMSKK